MVFTVRRNRTTGAETQTDPPVSTPPVIDVELDRLIQRCELLPDPAVLDWVEACVGHTAEFLNNYRTSASHPEFLFEAERSAHYQHEMLGILTRRARAPRASA